MGKQILIKNPKTYNKENKASSINGAWEKWKTTCKIMKLD